MPAEEWIINQNADHHHGRSLSSTTTGWTDGRWRAVMGEKYFKADVGGKSACVCDISILKLTTRALCYVYVKDFFFNNKYVK